MKSKPISPTWFNLFVPAALAAHFLFPIEIILQTPIRFLGLLLVLVGIALNQYASSLLRNARTPLEFGERAVRLVATGPFRFSRNPIYLGGILLLLGLAITLGSLVSFIFPALLFFILEWKYVPLEEKAMEAACGDDYVRYKQRVKRWL